MKRFITALLAAAVAGALFVASPLVAMPKGTENYNKSSERDAAAADECGKGNSATLVAPETLWPPNHKYYDGELFVQAVDTDGQSITLSTTGTHDQYDGDTGAEQNGSGNTGDDITVADPDGGALTEESTDAQPVAAETKSGTVRTDWVARAERSGRFKEGRTYTFSGTATFSDGSCTVSTTFAVPHDMRKSNREPAIEG
jgi:hypothetical protein